jgi:uncharacterized protein
MSEMHSGRTIRFLCDQNLGRLAKWLRVLGFDTELMKYWDLHRVEQAVVDGRVVITRKSTVKACAGVLFIPHDHLAEQMHLVKETFGLDKSSRPFSRCIICNEPLNSVSREQVKGLVPEYVYSTQENFSACPACRRIYWKGTHAEKAQALMGRLLEKE